MSSVVIHQPEYFPWINLFFKMMKSDKFIFLDHVQYSRRSFQNRNILGKDGNFFYITVPIKYSSRDTLIKDIKIDNSKKWKEDHIKNLHHCYKKTKFFKIVMDLIETEFFKNHEYLNDLNQALIQTIASKMGIKCEFVSSYRLNVKGKKSDLILNLCKKINAEEYITGTGSKGYLEEEKFKQNKIQVNYIKLNDVRYFQENSKKKFIKDLSILDYLFNVGFEDFKKI
tara:strand:+ start:1902 stop:2582 length:681 start_codon:yes stop_codon:yes gene_type:complete